MWCGPNWLEGVAPAATYCRFESCHHTIPLEKESMTTSFTKAAVSYYGIEAGLPVRTDINTAEDGVLYLTLSIAIKDEDLGPIVKRMSGIEQKEEFEPLFTADISDDEMRCDYTALQPGLKSRFGSFARYKAWRMENKQPAAEQKGIGTALHGEVGESAEGWKGVWLRKLELNPNQIAHGDWPRSGGMVLVPFDCMSEYQKMGRPKDPDAVESSEGIGGRKVQHVDVADEQEAVSELPAAVWMPESDLTDVQKHMASDHDPRKGSYLVQVSMLDDRQLSLIGR